jgi:hypothetical protein
MASPEASDEEGGGCLKTPDCSCTSCTTKSQLRWLRMFEDALPDELHSLASLDADDVDIEAVQEALRTPPPALVTVSKGDDVEHAPPAKDACTPCDRPGRRSTMWRRILSSALPSRPSRGITTRPNESAAGAECRTQNHSDHGGSWSAAIGSRLRRRVSSMSIVSVRPWTGLNRRAVRKARERSQRRATAAAAAAAAATSRAPPPPATATIEAVDEGLHVDDQTAEAMRTPTISDDDDLEMGI